MTSSSLCAALALSAVLGVGAAKMVDYTQIERPLEAKISESYKQGWLAGANYRDDQAYKLGYLQGWEAGDETGYWNSSVDTIYGENLYSVDPTDTKVLKISKRVATLPKNFKGALK